MINRIEFYDLQKKSGLSNKKCANYLEVTVRTVERWRVDNPSAPKAVILAMQAYKRLDNKGEMKDENSTGNC